MKRNTPKAPIAAKYGDPAPRLLYSTTSREAADERIRRAVRNNWNVVECIEDASGLINIIFEKAQVL